jgi:type I restriction enzyme S subunit
MKKHTKDSLRDIITQLPNDQFSFNDLRMLVSSDYDTLKDMVFALLGEAKPAFKQVFDSKANAMRFVRVK